MMSMTGTMSIFMCITHRWFILIIGGIHRIGLFVLHPGGLFTITSGIHTGGTGLSGEIPIIGHRSIIMAAGLIIIPIALIIIGRTIFIPATIMMMAMAAAPDGLMVHRGQWSPIRWSSAEAATIMAIKGFRAANPH